MTVLEYLKVINGVSEDVDFIPEMISMIGFIDVIPKIDGKIKEQSKVDFSIINEKLIAKRSFELTDGSALVEKRTSLYDDISLHCGKFASPEELIRKTIAGLKNLQDSELLDDSEKKDYQSKIDAFEQVLISIAQNNNNFKK